MLDRLLGTRPVDLKRVSASVRRQRGLEDQLILLCRASDPAEKIGGIEEAVVLAGAERVRLLIVTCHLLDRAARLAGGAHIRLCREHLLAVALMSRTIAQWVSYPKPGNAFAAGLLHDIGILPLFGPGGAASHGEEEPDPTIGERENYGIDHCEIGRQIGAFWNFPPAVLDVVVHHHHPEDAVDDPQLVGIVAAADRLCARRMAVQSS